MLYCPVCFNQTLELSSRGTVRLEVNGKHRDANIVLFDLSRDSKEDVLRHFREKIDDFMKWYSNLRSHEPIQSFKAFSGNFQCSSRCRLGNSGNLSVVGVLVTKKEILGLLKELGEKYGVDIDSDIEI